MSEISIIIPCFNHGRFLKEAVQSVLDQTVSVERIVVVDDGSDDTETHRALREVETMERVTVLTQKNQGPAAARNRAMEEVETPFVASLDADDRLLPEFVEKLLPRIHKKNTVGIAYGEARSFGTEEKVHQPRSYHFPDVLLDPCIYSTAIFRREDWEAVGGFREEMRSGWEDFEFWISLIELGREVVFVDEPVFEYRRHESSRDLNFSASKERILEAFETIYRHHRDLYSDHIRILFEAHLERLDWRSRFGGEISPELRFRQDGEVHTLAPKELFREEQTWIARFPLDGARFEGGEFRFDPFEGPGEFQMTRLRVVDGPEEKVPPREWSADECRVLGHSFGKDLTAEAGSWPKVFFLGRDPQVNFQMRDRSGFLPNACLEIAFKVRTGSPIIGEFLGHLDEIEGDCNARADALRGTQLELAHVKSELEKEMAKRRAIQRSWGYRLGRWFGRVGLKDSRIM